MYRIDYILKGHPSLSPFTTLEEDVKLLKQIVKEQEEEISLLKDQRESSTMTCQSDECHAMKVALEEMILKENMSNISMKKAGVKADRLLVSSASNDRLVMQGIASSLGSEVGLGWTPTTDPCSEQWFGVTCDSEGYVTIINLNGAQLAGMYLITILWIHLSLSTSPHSNLVDVEVFASLSSLERLAILSLGNAQLAGGISCCQRCT